MCRLGSIGGMRTLSHGKATWSPPAEGDSDRHIRPTANAPHLDPRGPLRTYAPGVRRAALSHRRCRAACLVLARNRLKKRLPLRDPETRDVVESWGAM